MSTSSRGSLLRGRSVADSHCDIQFSGHMQNRGAMRKIKIIRATMNVVIRDAL